MDHGKPQHSIIKISSQVKTWILDLFHTKQECSNLTTRFISNRVTGWCVNIILHWNTSVFGCVSRWKADVIKTLIRTVWRQFFPFSVHRLSIPSFIIHWKDTKNVKHLIFKWQNLEYYQYILLSTNGLKKYEECIKQKPHTDSCTPGQSKHTHSPTQPSEQIYAYTLTPMQTHAYTHTHAHTFYSAYLNDLGVHLWQIQIRSFSFCASLGNKTWRQIIF